MTKLLLPVMAAGLLLSSCAKDAGKLNDQASGISSRMAADLLAGSATGNSKDKIYSGPEVSFKKGKITTLYQVDNMERPVRLAISINNAAWNSLDMAAPGNSGHDPMNSVILKFHPKVDAKIFNHAEVDWNPHGHEPEQIYGLPHFDFHFYNMSVADVEAIPPFDVDPSKFLNVPAPAYLPLFYFNPGGGVPQMGCHWLDGTSPELNGGIFGQTFIYGTYNGRVTFLEPMITRAFLEANPAFTRPIPQPAKVAITGYYPTTLRLQKTDDAYLIILEDFQYREAS
ncbi:DUF5602 domain-containing protein [Niabella drilacis]|uniref:Uncharacterized protein n=1 Tax=Niabella drilacis (strain DSM 25811 / CCM 8410 / CCUG 62505 / LMG 26954 / E90) TaxID=1285928 RepID=A0A1G6JJY9_NIADE|nr:DUF5602 domain-containing protein [Niabella drilacis]SDC19034.1 hypothetical protein SAMN04487894_101559 [Niabella drilacis]